MLNVEFFSILTASLLDTRGPPECWQDPPSVILRVSWLAHLALSVNSSTNFLVYVFWGAKFRKAFWKTIGELLRRLQSVFPNTRTTNEKYNLF